MFTLRARLDETAEECPSHAHVQFFVRESCLSKEFVVFPPTHAISTRSPTNEGLLKESQDGSATTGFPFSSLSDQSMLQLVVAGEATFQNIS